MDRIFLLDDALINKIAAGEVIDRPSSVIKELIENSIDAKATKIIIETIEAGKTYIKVSDNGIGMSYNDANLSWKRHATSKIKSKEDLFSIKTYGFRGEALASIAAVSELIITTKEENSDLGIKIYIKGGKKITDEHIACPNGTTIEVKNLFYNTPARKKYLKSNETEFTQIIDIVTRYALINNSIHFVLYHNNKEILNSPITNNLINNISFVYGQHIIKEMIEVNYKNNFCSIYGYISMPSLTRSTKDEQSIFINKRYIKKNKIISDAIEDAYKTYVMVNRYPIVILDIEIPYEKTDVNVHPQKAEIRVEDEAYLYTTVYEAIRETLYNNKKILEVTPDFNKLKKHLKSYKEDNLYKTTLNKTTLKIDNENNILENQEKKINNELKNKKEKKYYYEYETQKLLSKEDEQTTTSNLPEMKILGVINKTFIIGEIKGGLIIIDQHAVAERILYENFTSQLKTNSIRIQELLNPDIIQLSSKNHNILIAKKDFFEKIGFKIEEFGKNSIILRTIPVVLGRQFSKEVLLDYVSELSRKDNLEDLNNLNSILPSFERFFHNKIAKMACRKAIKAGDNITLPQIKKHITELSEKYLPYTCPHGRPIFIKFSIYDLEKLFKRIV